MKKTLLTAVALAALSTSAFAEGTGTINFTGEIVAGACGIDSGSDNQTVNLGKVPTNVFKQAGDKSTPANFDIKLTDCDTSIAQNAYFKFTGTSSAGEPKLLATIGSATNVGIRLQAASGEYLDNGVEQKAPTVLQNGTNVARFAAMYESTAASVTPGTANGVANFTVRYQ
ncbi:fimbrial protein [Burkholderia pseudomultivorans]|uniref:Type-1 fimbrial protein, A chain n=1 Tax=Burkholderia pseudomultivorans TaxID=1207504 RepID=A0ABU2E0Q4_9BURK|nr:fimbrial protein [Burkholderia pseudomultivorans]MDR8730908.1 Type-1 fimbrial protein, A chain [Burkholderia pseudomultivorans]MDR8734213.1 Type-1 fimbrial protein, A chain [Burkholderia pseudomultivorans]MDR8744418.1 Type-1 fimbrial protein, A chain [Burkholderia pseudomultivorans]MDR8753299.1 Type-1 fimbrial protein, A chain [Burkholderia pseudomultivorans]MDR8778771.1 Type-1 fimbrial protein, A chain [Burkholderia pseudomultivorans]